MRADTGVAREAVVISAVAAPPSFTLQPERKKTKKKNKMRKREGKRERERERERVKKKKKLTERRIVVEKQLEKGINTRRTHKKKQKEIETQANWEAGHSIGKTNVLGITHRSLWCAPH